MLSLQVSSTESLQAQSSANLATSLDPARHSPFSIAASAGTDSTAGFSIKCEEGLAHHIPTGLPHSTGFQHLLQDSSAFQSSLDSSVITSSTAVTELDQEMVHVKLAPIVPLSDIVRSGFAVGSNINNTSDTVLESSAVPSAGSFVSCPLASYPTTPLSATPPTSRPNSPLTPPITPNYQSILSPTPAVSPFTPCSLSPSPSPFTPPDIPASPGLEDQMGIDVLGTYPHREFIADVPLGEDQHLCFTLGDDTDILSDGKGNKDDPGQKDEQLTEKTHDSITKLSQDVHENAGLVADSVTSVEHVKLSLKELQRPDDHKKCANEPSPKGVESSSYDQAIGEIMDQYQLPHVSSITKKPDAVANKEGNTISIETDHLAFSPEKTSSSFASCVEALEDSNTSESVTEKSTVLDMNSDVDHSTLAESEVQKHDDTDTSANVDERTSASLGNQGDRPKVLEGSSPSYTSNASSQTVKDYLVVPDNNCVKLEQLNLQLILSVGTNDENQTKEKSISGNLMVSEERKYGVSLDLKNDTRSDENEEHGLENTLCDKIATQVKFHKEDCQPLTELMCVSTMTDSHNDCGIGALHEDEGPPQNYPLPDRELIDTEHLKDDFGENIQKPTQDSGSSAHLKSYSNNDDVVGPILSSNSWPMLAHHKNMYISSQESLEPPRVQLKAFGSDDAMCNKKAPQFRGPADVNVDSVDSSTNETKVTSIIVPSHLKCNPSDMSVSSLDTVIPSSNDLMFIGACPLGLMSSCYDQENAKLRTHICTPALPTDTTATELARDSWDSVMSTPVDMIISDSKSSQSLFDSEFAGSNTLVKPTGDGAQLEPSAASSNLSASVPTNSTLTTVSEMSSNTNDVQSPTSLGKFMGVPLIMDSLLLYSDSEQVSSGTDGSPNVCASFLDEEDYLSFQLSSQEDQQEITGFSQSKNLQFPWEGLEFGCGTPLEKTSSTCVDPLPLTKENRSSPGADDVTSKEPKAISDGKDEHLCPVDVVGEDELSDVSGLASDLGDMATAGSLFSCDYLKPDLTPGCSENAQKVNIHVDDQNFSISTTVKNISSSSLDSTIICSNMSSSTAAANASHFCDILSDEECWEVNEDKMAHTESVQSESGQFVAESLVVSDIEADCLDKKSSVLSLANNLNTPSSISLVGDDVVSNCTPEGDNAGESLTKHPPSYSPSSRAKYFLMSESRSDAGKNPIIPPPESRESIESKCSEGKTNLHGMSFSREDNSSSVEKFDDGINNSSSYSTLLKDEQTSGVCILIRLPPFLVLHKKFF